MDGVSIILTPILFVSPDFVSRGYFLYYTLVMTVFDWTILTYHHFNIIFKLKKRKTLTIFNIHTCIFMDILYNYRYNTTTTNKNIK